MFNKQVKVKRKNLSILPRQFPHFSMISSNYEYVQHGAENRLYIENWNAQGKKLRLLDFECMQSTEVHTKMKVFK